jgi:hypothetical protein
MLGSCLSGMTAALLAADYGWKRLNHTIIDRSDLFLKYFIYRAPMPSRALFETLFRLKPECAGEAHVFDRMFRETTGRFELPADTRPFFENLEHERFDVLLLDNLFDTSNIKSVYRSLTGTLDFEHTFPLHFCEDSSARADSNEFLPRLSPEESARSWAAIVRYLRSVQPEAHIMFLCMPASTLAGDPDRQARAKAFPAALQAALGGDPLEIVPPFDIPPELTKLPDDPDHFDLRVYRALAGRVFTSYLIAQAAAMAASMEVSDAA